MTLLVGIPGIIQNLFQPYRDIFCKDAGFQHILRYIMGLLLSPNKTLTGIHDNLVGDDLSSSRAMHASVFEGNWSRDLLMNRHRKNISQYYENTIQRITIDWTFVHHEKGLHIFGVKKKGYDYVENRYGNFQTVLTSTISNNKFTDGIDVVIQEPADLEKEKIYLNATVQLKYDSKEAAQTRLLELLHHQIHVQSYKTKTELFIERVHLYEKEGNFPNSVYLFDNGVLSKKLTDCIESYGKKWLSELEKNRNVRWKNKWTNICKIDEELVSSHPEAFREIITLDTDKNIQRSYVFTKTVRLKQYNKVKIAIVHKKKDLSDKPTYLITNMLHWEAKRILNEWKFRWKIEPFHEFTKQFSGLEDSQVRNQKAVKTHLCLSCISQSILQHCDAPLSTSERFKFSQGKISIGQKVRAISRESVRLLVKQVRIWDQQRYSIDSILNKLVPV